MRYYKSGLLYYKLRQNAITNYGSFITNYGNMLLENTAALSNYYKLRQHIITNYAVITNYVATGRCVFFNLNIVFEQNLKLILWAYTFRQNLYFTKS